MAIYERMTVKGRGAVLPQYQSSQGANAPGVNVSARLDDSGARIVGQSSAEYARAAASLGVGIRKAAGQVEGAYWDYSKTKATQLMNEYRSQMKHILSGEDGILSRKGEAAFTAGDDALSASKKLRASLLKEYGDDSLVGRFFSDNARDAENDFHIQAVGHQDKEYNNWQNAQDDAAVDEAADDAAMNYGNMDAFSKAAGRAMHHMQSKLERMGISGAALDRGMKECTSRIFKAGITRAIASGDISSAQRLLGEGSKPRGEEGRQYMTGEDIADAKLKIDQKKEIEAAKAERAAAAAERKAAAAADRAIRQQGVTDAASWWESVKEMPIEDMELMAAKTALSISDQKRRGAFEQAAKAQIDLAKKVKKVSDAEGVRNFEKLADQEGWGPVRRREMLENSNLSEEAREIAQKRLDAGRKKETPENRAAAAKLRSEIDRDIAGDGSGVDSKSPEDIESEGMKRGLTDAQIKSVQTYAANGGKLNGLSQSSVAGVLSELTGKSKSQCAKKAEELFDLIPAELADGEKITKQKLREVVSRLIMEGGSKREFGIGSWRWTTSETYAEAKKNGRADRFSVKIDDIPENDRERVRRKLERENEKRRAEGKKEFLLTDERIAEFWLKEKK